MEFSNKTVGVLLAVILTGLISTTSAYDFYVGGKDGWVRNPSESFDHWAGRMRFSVHDRLVFKFKKGEDSVLQVSKQGYDSCNVTAAIKKMDDGESTFEFDRSGPFYFISGANGSCAMGQKLRVVVMADRTKPVPTPPPSSSPPSPSPSPSSASPSPSPSSVSPSLSPSSVSPSPSSVSPSSSPSSVSPSPSPSSASPSPSSVSPSPSPSTVSPPSPSPNSSPSASPNSSPPTATSPDVSLAPGPSPSENNQSSAIRASTLSIGMLIIMLLATGAAMN